MRLTLTIENQTNLPDGGPVTFSVSGARGLDIGRDQYLDWTLPDPTRFISGKHCEVRCEKGEYLLYDVSTNGTFLNGSDQRMQSPHRLRTGDRLSIGQYIVAVAVEGVAAAAPGGLDPAPAMRSSPGELWSVDEGIAPPIDPRELRDRSVGRPVRPDFMESSADAFAPLPDFGAPDPVPYRPAPASPSRLQDLPSSMDWDAGPRPAAPMPAPEPPMPSPRRVVSPGAGGVWAAGGDDAANPASGSASPAAADDWAAPPSTPREAAPAPPPAASAGADAPPLVPSAGSAGADEFVRRFAAAAGIAPETLARTDPGELADTLGQVMRLVTSEMMQLLSARSEAKRMTRSSSQTMIQALDNNPLKFSPTPEEAMRILLGPKTRSYLDSRRALAAGFADLKTHQVKTYAAMQQAARRLADEFAPDAVEAGVPPESGLGAVIGSRRARLWDAYVTRWKTTTERHDDGLVDVFMLYFAECYDRG